MKDNDVRNQSVKIKYAEEVVNKSVLLNAIVEAISWDDEKENEGENENH